MTLVLDSSAVLAALLREAGAEVVRDHLSNARVSAVNLAEIVAVLARSNPAERVAEILRELRLDVSPANAEMAIDAGLLGPITASVGLGTVSVSRSREASARPLRRRIAHGSELPMRSASRSG